MKKKVYLISLIIVIVITIIIFLFIESIKRNEVIVKYLPQHLFCLPKSQFLSDIQQSKWDYTKSEQNVYRLNSDDTIRYVYENFDTQRDYSRVIEQFESLLNLNIDKNIADISLSKEKINGGSALAVRIKQNAVKENKLIIKSDFDNAIDLKRWNNYGFISGWIKLENRNDITGINIKIGDEFGNYREYETLPNLQIGIPNFFNENDAYPDIKYPIRNTTSDEWTDFWLNNGWNYLLWRADKEFYKDTGSVDIEHIKWSEITLLLNKDIASNENILLDDFRIQDGLQKDANPVGNFWYPPHGRPQYGIFDVDEINPQDYVLKLLNVRQTQYPSNGDHGRMITKGTTPLNFVMRVKFKLVDLNSNRDNTWLRIMYDFDPVWDPGHDWFGVYESLEWNKFGLITVIPIERFSTQEQEPKKENIALSSKNYSIKENKIYEIHLTIEGQKAKATLFSTGSKCFKIKKSVEYEFSRERYDIQKRYPITIEITGNTKAIIYEVEIFEL